MKYNTKQREQILDFLASSNGNHIKAEDILEHMKENGTPVGKSTVYRYLDNLVEENIIRKYTIEDGVGACYQYIGKNVHCKEHYHLKCSNCGRLFHVSCEFMDEINNHILKEHNFTIDNSKTVFYGICENCNDNIGNEKAGNEKAGNEKAGNEINIDEKVDYKDSDITNVKYKKHKCCCGKNEEHIYKEHTDEDGKDE